MAMIPVAKPMLDEREVEAVRRVVLSGWVTQGPEVAAFESDFAAFVGAGGYGERIVQGLALNDSKLLLAGALPAAALAVLAQMLFELAERRVRYR